MPLEPLASRRPKTIWTTWARESSKRSTGLRLKRASTSKNKIPKRFFEDCVHPGQNRSPDRGRDAAALPEEEGMGFSYSSTLASFISPRWTILSFISFSSIHPSCSSYRFLIILLSTEVYINTHKFHAYRDTESRFFNVRQASLRNRLT